MGWRNYCKIQARLTQGAVLHFFVEPPLSLLEKLGRLGQGPRIWVSARMERDLALSVLPKGVLTLTHWGFLSWEVTETELLFLRQRWTRLGHTEEFPLSLRDLQYGVGRLEPGQVWVFEP